MKKEQQQYEVTLTLTEHESITVHADSPHAAVEAAILEAPSGFIPSDVSCKTKGKDWLYCGACEGCDNPLLEGDDYYTDSDGIRLCKKCHKAMMADLNICVEQQ